LKPPGSTVVCFLSKLFFDLGSMTDPFLDVCLFLMASISNRYMLVSWDPVVINKAIKMFNIKKQAKERGFHDQFFLPENEGMSPLKRNHLTKGYFSNLTFSIQTLPICSMYGIFAHIYDEFKPNVGK